MRLQPLTEATPVLRIDTVYEDDDLKLRWMRGRTSRLVVVFTGMHGGVGGSVDEFARSASLGGDNNVLFVTDKRATWYAAPGLWRRIVRMIKQVRAAEGIGEVISLGNSMGGFGALMMPRDIRTARAIAFSPQATMDRTILDDRRWPDVHKRFRDLPMRAAGDVILSVRTQFYVAAGGACAEDVAHLDLLPEHKRVHRYVLPAARHNLAAALKAQGLLDNVISFIIRGRKNKLERTFAAYREAVA